MLNQKKLILTPNWPANLNISAFTTLKSCNIQKLTLPKQQCWLQQEHGTQILRADQHSDKNGLSTDLPSADGAFTLNKQVAYVIKTADCLPILITNKQSNFVAAIHAGWRGLSAGIIKNLGVTIKVLNLPLSDLLFWFGPAIGPLAFVVDEPVANHFKLYPSSLTKIKHSDKYLINIYRIAKMHLYELGINSNQIFSCNYCTYYQNDLFYSHRRNNLSHERMYSFIWIE